MVACGEAEKERRECFKHLFKKTWAVAGDSSPPLRNIKNQHLEIFFFFFLKKLHKVNLENLKSKENH